jgi:hypothetical protein
VACSFAADVAAARAVTSVLPRRGLSAMPGSAVFAADFLPLFAADFRPVGASAEAVFLRVAICQRSVS